MEKLRVSDLMTPDPVTVSPRDTVLTALELMRDSRIRHVPVVEDDGELIGILSDRDLSSAPAVIVRRRSAEDADEVEEAEEEEIRGREAVRALPVQDVYVRDPETIDEDADLSEAARILLENKFGCLPVMRGHELVGIVTESDFVRFVLGQLEGEPDERREGKLQGATRP
jgi:CBS domain-containing membrane protein